jgi:penicillin-binding protein 1A
MARKKNAGTLFMDFHVSPDDRIGVEPKKGRSKSSEPKRSWGQRRQRIEPQLEGNAALYVEDDVAPQKPARRGKVAKTRGRKAKKPLTLWGMALKAIYWVFLLGIWAGVAVAGIIAYYAIQLPNSDTWAVPERPANIRIVASDGQLISNRGKTGGEAVSLRELPHYVSAAVLAIEDRRFYEHFGIDLVGLVSVGLESIRAGEVTRGASTITQQLAKNLFLTPDQTLGRKVQEAVLAVWLEQNYSKDDILELYLNRMFFGTDGQGRPLLGIEAAAQNFYGKSARNLSLGEAAILAGSLQAPSRLNPRGDPARVKERQTLVLQAMARAGYITPEEARAAEIDPNQQIRTRVAGSEYYVADWVETLVQAYVGDIKEDVIVTTTINWDLQKHAEFIVREAVANEGESRGFSQGALVAMDVDGTIRAVVGGTDYAQSQYNRAVTGRRQPGSAFKPFIYMAAMEKGYTPDTVADDAPFDYNGWSPQNASGKYVGPVTLRDALAYSLNTVSARLAIDVGPDKVVEAAMRMGISSSLAAVPSIALGTSEVSLLELTAAYAPFANGGYGVIANVITQIKTADGEILYQATPAGPGQVVAPNIVAEMNDMLTTALEIGTGKRAQLDGWPIAGKTGTSQKARDALFVGYTARMVTGVWLGNDDDTSTSLSGGNVPVEIWSEFMTKAHEGMAVSELPGAYQTPPTDLTLSPMEQPRRSTTTIVDILSGIFGGG